MSYGGGGGGEGLWGGKVSSVGPSCHVRVHRVDILKNLRAHGSRGEPGVFSLKKKKTCRGFLWHHCYAKG